ncbi:MAG: HD-GYP domain-containing protein [Halanaerobiaceae bacterium]|jgi:putative nucleotidyltransferase with HDIG domain|nr:HD-GYP domain-containing protein [Halanaerobiaceae bacterium]
MLKVRKVFVDELEPGMRVAREIENQFGAILVNDGMILDENLIEKLKRLGISTVEIFNESDKDLDENRYKFKEQYQESIGNVKEIIHDARNDYINFSNLKRIADNSLKMDTNRDIITMLSIVRGADEYTYSHSVNVGILAMIFGRWAGLDYKGIKQLLYAGMLHDIGKAKIPDEILNKKGSLTEEEYNIMKMHSLYGYEITKSCKLISEKVRRAVLLHHERNDGSGYPFGFRKDKIPFMARVLAIVDTYDAMTSDRVYRGHRPPFDVFRLFEEDLQSYDILLTRMFMTNMAQYYIGEVVELTDGQKGEIVFINPSYISKPIVKINGEYLNLVNEDLAIKEVYLKSPIDELY